MGKTNRDQVRTRRVDDEDENPAIRKESKKKHKRMRRKAEKSIKDAVLSGEYDEDFFDDDYSDDAWDG